jgi:phenylpropionate dioxygenase-like ring-hydroxylating dioxygenase large terminal subunit
VVCVDDDWYAVCRSFELAKKPIAVTLLGAPLVVYRTQGGIGALLDRCAHRNVPLSLGKTTSDRIECPYHGWQFGPDGECRHIPCLIGDTEARARKVPAYAARELDGHIFVYGRPDVVPLREPYRFPYYGDDRYTKIHFAMDLPGSVHAVAENALDVPHTAFLHGGLFRKPGRDHPIDVVIRRDNDMCEAEYLGEPAPKGLIGRLLAPGGGEVQHTDRFRLPAVTEVEYRLGDDSHLVVASALCPLGDFETRLFAVAAFRLPWFLPARVVGVVAQPIARLILAQDRRMLRHQTGAIRRFGGEQLISTDVDVLGPHILRLLKNAEAGRRDSGDEERGRDVPFERRVTMRV